MQRVKERDFKVANWTRFRVFLSKIHGYTYCTMVQYLIFAYFFIQKDASHATKTLQKKKVDRANYSKS